MKGREVRDIESERFIAAVSCSGWARPFLRCQGKILPAMPDGAACIANRRFPRGLGASEQLDPQGVSAGSCKGRIACHRCSRSALTALPGGTRVKSALAKLREPKARKGS